MPETALLFIHALTGLHPGSGTALGHVDLPVARERHTGWPLIPASTLKGVLRDACRPSATEGEDYDRWCAIFGPETKEADLHSGAVSLTDARILAFPVRSLKSVFAWVTCPAVLKRLNRDLSLVKDETPWQDKDIPTVGEGEAVCADGSPLLIDGNSLVLEEFDFTHTDGSTGQLADWMANRAVSDDGTARRIRDHLVVLDDNAFGHFVRHATEVTARIGLEYETKTVKEGALFYEEYLPAETLFYSLAFAEPSRRNAVPMTAKDVRQHVAERTPAVLQIGADETIGKGLCAVRLHQPQKVTA